MKRRQQMDMTMNKNKLIKPIIICCLCAKIGSEEVFISIFSTKGKINQLQEKIINYTPFKVDRDDNVQQYICDTCVLKINQWHDFIEACIDAQNKLNISPTKSRDLVEAKNFTSTNTETPVSNSSPEKQCSVTASLNKSNFIRNTFLSSKKTEPKILDPPETLLKSSNEKASLPNRSPGRMYCIARWCGNSTKNSSISLFRLPKDVKRAHLWLTNAEREDLKSLSPQILHTKYLCMEHFTDDMFMNSCKKKLVWNAIPTHFPKPKYAVKKVSIETNDSVQNNTVFPAQLIFISKAHCSNKQRPIKPKPVDMNERQTADLSKHTRSVSDNSEDSVMASALTEIEKSSKMRNNSANKIPTARIMKTSTISSSETKNVEIPVEDLNPAKPVTLKTCDNVNNLIDLRKQDKVQIVRRSSELSNTDISKRDDNNCLLKNTCDNFSFITEESYLNCDTESICLEHAYQETNERIYPCQYCGEMFLVKSNLILHQTTYHSDRPVGCESCGRVLYKSRSEFMEHVCDRHIDSIHNEAH